MHLGYDFYYFYAAATLLLNGKDVYDLEQLRQALSILGRDPDSQIVGFPYPPWTFYLYVPFGLLPFETAFLLWTAVQLSFLTLSVWLLLESGERLWSRRSLSSQELFFFTLLFFPCFKLLYCGQITTFSLLGLSLVLSRYGQRFSWLQGFGLALMVTKPHLSAPFIVGFCFASVKDRLSLFGSLVFGVFLQFGLSYLVGASSFGTYLMHVKLFLQESEVLLQPTLFSIIRYLSGSTYFPTWWLIGGVCGGSILSFILRSCSSSHRSLLLIAYSLCVAPYAWTHDYILLLPHYLQLIGSLKDVVRNRIREVFHLGQFLLLLPTLIWPRWEFASVVLPLSFFLLLRVKQRLST